ncbi:phosphatase PAP2 family protein [uncultured Aquabacterium sp.]|uniref:phosphatase PAP2 family protein n=1 Tax=Aquabacterium sp. TaxID=1872578 RepID=UPI0025FE7162|nr:phosphatase PAP2 family protein [uncultured Aquabacterium sp.]
MAMMPPEPDKPAPPEWTPWLTARLLWPWLCRGGVTCQEWERACALWLHRATVRPSVLIVMQLISRLSDGLIWYLTFPALWLWGGPSGLHCMLRLAGMSGVNLIVYKALKQGTGRPRPFRSCPGIRVCARALDEFSFPSGHTLHAVAFAVMLSTYYPVLTWPLGVFAGLVALSRVVLGLHYPSDVLIGALIGAVSAWATLNLF